MLNITLNVWRAIENKERKWYILSGIESELYRRNHMIQKTKDQWVKEIEKMENIIKHDVYILWTRIFHTRPHSIGETRFFNYLWKINFWKKKSWSCHLFYFYFKGKIKQERKTLKNDSIIFGKRHVFEKPESRSGDQVTYWEGTFKR